MPQLLDHREINKTLEIFANEPLCGSGFVTWLPNGVKLLSRLQTIIHQQELKYHFVRVQTPIVAHKSLYVKSGHWKHYQQNIFPPMQINVSNHATKAITPEIESEELVLRPMTCPHHCLLFQAKLRSYRDLPLRFCEDSYLYRNEYSGAILGLERVKAMTLTEGHIFATKDQAVDEILMCLEQITATMKIFDLEPTYYRLSLPDLVNDPKSYHDDTTTWQQAVQMLRQALEKSQIKIVEGVGEATFYGPKIDIQMSSVLGHDITISTIQLDFLLPKNFNLAYIDADQQRCQPVIIHRGLIGTYERFVSLYLEKTQGHLPLLTAFNPIGILPVNPLLHAQKAFDLAKALPDNSYSVFATTESFGKRLATLRQQKFTMNVILGDKEIQNNMISYQEFNPKTKTYSSPVSMSQADFILMINQAYQLSPLAPSH